MNVDDLIRRCDVLDNINKRIYYFDKASLDEARNAVHNVPAVDAMPRWISVEERLPEDDVNVLIYAVSNGDDVDSCIAMTSYTHRMHGFNIEGWRSPWQYFFFDYMITHWMPLPRTAEGGMNMKYFKNLAISSRREWNGLEAEVDKLKRELKRTKEENADLQAKLNAYETGCLYGGSHCEVCKKSRKVSAFMVYNRECYEQKNHICTLHVPCGQFEPKEDE